MDIEEKLKNNSKLLFKLDLAFENYEDDNNVSIPLLEKTTQELNIFRKSKSKMSIGEQYTKTIDLIEMYNKVLDIVGRDNFIFYDNGDVNYIGKSQK